MPRLCNSYDINLGYYNENTFVTSYTNVESTAVKSAQKYRFFTT